MSGRTLVNQRQHVGLQKLSALAGVAPSFLGPHKKWKFIQDGANGECAILVCSCFRLLENAEVTCAVGQLVCETVRAQQKIYHSGTGCLLFLAGAWSRAALQCLQKGIPVPHIIAAMSEGMDICLDTCKKTRVPMEDVCLTCAENGVATSEQSHLMLPKQPAAGLSREMPRLGWTVGGNKNHSSRAPWKPKLTHSRHFCEAKSDVSALSASRSQNSKTVDISRVARAVCHGCVHAMDLVIEASRLQSQSSAGDACCSTFDVSKVVTCLLPGLTEEHACVLPGCVVLLSDERVPVAQHLQQRPLTVALVNGDLCHKYRHLGFNKPTGVGRMTDKLEPGTLGKEDEWTESVLRVLLKVNVNLVLVSGTVSEKLLQRCFSHHILVVGKIKASVLKAFANATGAVPITYATQLTMHSVGTGAQVVLWRDVSSDQRRPSVAVSISTESSSGLVTAVLASCVHGKLQGLEDQFWSCCYRLHHALKDRELLPGAGVTEMLCIHHLQKQAEVRVKRPAVMTGDSVQPPEGDGGGNPYRDVVLCLMADGLTDYVSNILMNGGGFSRLGAWTAVGQQVRDLKGEFSIDAKFSGLLLASDAVESGVPSDGQSGEAAELKVYDNLSVKVEAWRKALDLVFLVLQTDAEVITGVDPKTAGAQENLFLL
ncbi:Bardet-Biedl syndrome 12 protein [Lampris incognitus]|uniref:Bardet-Biedl syndrome 12 protein n=1 Tax=Lampris incognitus TaxID=2546036 RepID=UPI0024B556EF|nr:Bardet-Biedl syndrome 12 protein [Lampris incognitus]